MDGQFGSCGKGAVISALNKYPHRTLESGPTVVVRAGGPQAGHSMLGPCPTPGYCFDRDNHASGNFHHWKMRQIPANWHTGGYSLISRGAMVNLKVLHEEVESIKRALGTSHAPSLIVDEDAWVVTHEHELAERTDSFGESGSTREGVGAARADMLLRKAKRIRDVINQPQYDWLKQYVQADTSAWLREKARSGANVWIEGTQGFGLSLRASGFYPHVTSWDITPQQLLADVGLHWLDAPVQTTMLLRTFPIRIAGNSGPLEEISWEDLGREPEFTTVTNMQRRIGIFDDKQVLRAVEECAPSEFIITFLDYLPSKAAQRAFIQHVENLTGVEVSFGSTGFEKLYARTEWS